MTHSELRELIQQTGRPKTAIYNVAKKLGRIPEPWEILVLSPPTKLGRPSHYILLTNLQSNALQIRNMMKECIDADTDALFYKRAADVFKRCQIDVNYYCEEKIIRNFVYLITDGTVSDELYNAINVEFLTIAKMLNNIIGGKNEDSH